MVPHWIRGIIGSLIAAVSRRVGRWSSGVVVLSEVGAVCRASLWRSGLAVSECGRRDRRWWCAVSTSDARSAGLRPGRRRTRPSSPAGDSGREVGGLGVRLLRPGELGAVAPHRQQDHRKLARRRHGCLLDPASVRQAHRPRFRPMTSAPRIASHGGSGRSPPRTAVRAWRYRRISRSAPSGRSRRTGVVAG